MKKISKEELARLQAAGVDIKPKNKPVKKAAVASKPKAELKPKKGPFEKFNTTGSSPEMKAAVAAAQRAAEAARDTSEQILTVIQEGTGKNREILNEIKDAVEIAPVIKVKINRGKDNLMTDLDLIRAN